MYWQRVLVREPRACFQIAGFRFSARTPSSRDHLIVFTQCDGLFHTRTVTRLRPTREAARPCSTEELDGAALEPARGFVGRSVRRLGVGF